MVWQCRDVHGKKGELASGRGTEMARGNVVLNPGRITTLCHPRAADTVCFWLFSIHFMLYLVRSIIVFFSRSPALPFALLLSIFSQHCHTRGIFTSRNKRWTSSNACSKWFRWCDCDVCISEWARASTAYLVESLMTIMIISINIKLFAIIKCDVYHESIYMLPLSTSLSLSLSARRIFTALPNGFELVKSC